ncbi:MAG: fibronectin type III domain-containing protein [Candidatus Kapabacteria bacterium]|nr:fibronectin type III domain-containing protein [Ignavibacteriota bacterium]MCW5884384.1 fibronectin type III domain-containing protein [Candidatus Kapabacteria bacterium]
MLKNKLFILLTALAMSIFVFSACEESGVDPDPTPQPKPSPASNLQATSINESTVHLMYQISPSESNTLWKDYEISWREDGGPTAGDSKVVLKGTNPIEVTGLTEGKVYIFTLVARYTNDSISSPITVRWSPATRFVKNVNDESIKVYETASNFGSGLQIFYEAEGAPRARTIDNSKDWDLALRTVDNKIVFSSATKSGYIFASGQTPDPTFIYKDYFTANSLDDIFDSRAMDDGARNNEYSELSFDITNFTNPTNIIFYVRKYQPGQTRYNYAKVMAKRPAGGGSFLQGSGTNRYIEFEISYQKTPDVPYAKTPSDNASN